MLAVACLSFPALVANVAGAAEFTVNPTRVHLDRARAIETLVLGNADAMPLGFEVTVKRWTMAADGSWQLVPSDDLVVHPLVFTVQPGNQARLRVGVLTPGSVDERAYRIELQQLPGEGGEGVQVELLTRISVPVFVQPPEAAPVSTLADVVFGMDGLRMVLANTGTGYLPPQDGRLRWLDGNGQVLAEVPLQVGYVLAGARLPLSTTTVPAGACRQAARVELHLPEAGKAVAAPLPAGPRPCGG